MSSREPLAVRADAPAALDVPPAHLELTWRALQVRDAEALHELAEVVAQHDAAHERVSPDEVLEMVTVPGIDLTKDSLGGFDDRGRLRAYALVEVRPGAGTVRAVLRGSVHPTWRGRGIGRAVLAWMEGRGRQKLAEIEGDLPGRLAVMVDEAARDQRRLYAAAGFSPIRWYTTMRRDLATPLPEARVPDGLRVVGWEEARSEAVRLAHNETFGDHWGSEPLTSEAWEHHDAHFAPAWSFVAVTDAGEVAGYVVSGRYPQDWPVLGYSCGFTDVLGVRRPWRGRGLGTALLVAAMTAYRADGMDNANLRVDTANPTGAVGLYERLGYVPEHGYVMYSVEI